MGINGHYNIHCAKFKDGRTIVEIGYNKFCKENDYNPRHVFNLSKGILLSHKDMIYAELHQYSDVKYEELLKAFINS